MNNEQRKSEHLPLETLLRSVENHKRSDIYPFLEKKFRSNIASHLCNTFFIGANKDRNTAFWQVDVSGKVKQCKIIKYDPTTGRRSKEQPVYFAGKKILGKEDAVLQQCFFGEFLLSLPENNHKTVAIVESEKTAVIASVYFPSLVWLATGGTHGAKWADSEVCKVLAGRKVILLPDLGAYEKWSEKGKQMANVAGCTVSVSDTLEKVATDVDRSNGLDIADYLLLNQDSTGLALTDHNYPVMWDYSIVKN